jgi:hypothetical protein
MDDRNIHLIDLQSQTPDERHNTVLMVMWNRYGGTKCQFCGHEWADAHDLYDNDAVASFDGNAAHSDCFQKWVMEHGMVAPSSED